MLTVNSFAEEENKLLFMTATDVAKSIREKKITSVEVVTKVNSQIQKHNKNYNAIVTLNTNALIEAKEADEKLAQGRILGPLHGEPIVIKDERLYCRRRCVSRKAIKRGWCNYHRQGKFANSRDGYADRQCRFWENEQSLGHISY